MTGFANVMSTDTVWVRRLTRAGAPGGVLQGVTFAVKELFDLEGEPRGCGNPYWRQRQSPSRSNATAVQQLLDAGARCKGSTTMDEFAFGLSGESPWSGCPPNSANPGCITGGSSSGSASAVASGEVDLALGTDTGGSIRVPASWCGLLGWRPTHGAVSVQGMQPLAPSLDTTGLFSRTPEVMLAAADVLMASSPSGPFPDSSPPAQLFWIPEFWSPLESSVRTALLQSCEQLSQTIHCEIEALPLATFGMNDPQQLQALFQAIQWEEIATTFAALPDDLTLGPVLERNLAMVRNRSREIQELVNQQRQHVRNRLAAALGDHGVLAQPITPCTAPAIGSFSLDRGAGSLVGQLIRLNALAGISGAPEVSVPTRGVENKPLGLGLIAAPGRDRLLMTTLQMCAGSLAAI